MPQSKSVPRFMQGYRKQVHVGARAPCFVGIQMHTGTMTFEQGVEFFEKEGYQSHANAVRETKRGTRDPTYLVYTLGKLQILKLRDDFRKKAGASFSLQRFHDDFLGQGTPPVKIVRRSMLGVDSPTL